MELFIVSLKRENKLRFGFCDLENVDFDRSHVQV